MKRSITIISLIIFGVVLVVSVYLLGNSGHSNTLSLSYQTSGGVPYKWEFEISNEDIVQFVRSEEIENQNTGSIVGAPITTNYIFKGVKSGIATITFKYVSVTDNSILKEEKHTIKVGKDKSISLVVNLAD